MEFGGGFCNPCQYILQRPILQQQRNQTHVINIDPLVSAQLEKERQDIDQYITLQNERLSLFLQEQRKQQMTSFLKGMEIKALFLERQKEEEIAKESRKTAQLEDLLRRVEIEKQTYQRTAIEKEAMAMALNKTLERIRGEMVCSSSAEDAESCCDLPDKFNEGIGKMTCKACNSGESRFIILPWRYRDEHGRATHPGANPRMEHDSPWGAVGSHGRWDPTAPPGELCSTPGFALG
ncbi:putative BOI-related E3 ubiquitin-protein ligase 2 [Cinnamomum micranthum f. kanehirae]|uniref:Putative BOI-related E3 ubiquitin-protein ligase 2 n=1 Tax=Cinnamomum micranthum f. kanehirae TaxID=337451 RepID=A0A3S3N4U0_9MAGN|nr:putative BOI-related E3 ubiquitin-protein ligase 2 [Cinnamomum micranthum f. kanehirae]